MRKTSKMMSRLNKKGYNYDPKKNKFRTRRNQDNSNKMCYNCGKYRHLSYDCPEPIKPKKRKKMRAINTSTQGRAMRRKTQARRDLSREKRISRPSLENGSPMAKTQVMIQMIMNPRRQLWESPCMMMMSHLYLHHQCASWQEVTTR